eukprot:2985971-Rhodomonas_salina.1
MCDFAFDFGGGANRVELALLHQEKLLEPHRDLPPRNRAFSRPPVSREATERKKTESNNCRWLRV